MLNTLHKCNYPFLGIRSHLPLCQLCLYASLFLCIDYINSRGKYYINDSEMHLLYIYANYKVHIKSQTNTLS